MKKFEQFINESTRETLDVSGYNLNWLSEGEVDGFKFVEKNQVSFDAEKGFVDYEVTLQRESDGKFFKGQITQQGYHGTELSETFKEVNEKTKTVSYYSWP